MSLYIGIVVLLALRKMFNGPICQTFSKLVKICIRFRWQIKFDISKPKACHIRIWSSVYLYQFETHTQKQVSPNKRLCLSVNSTIWMVHLPYLPLPKCYKLNLIIGSDNAGCFRNFLLLLMFVSAKTIAFDLTREKIKVWNIKLWSILNVCFTMISHTR